MNQFMDNTWIPASIYELVIYPLLMSWSFSFYFKEKTTSFRQINHIVHASCDNILRN